MTTNNKNNENPDMPKTGGDPQCITTEGLLAAAEEFINEGHPEKAFDIYKRIVIAEPNVTAQFNLASLYAQGRGIEQNFTEGAYWFHKAEMGGDEKAGKLAEKCELDHMRIGLEESSPEELYKKMNRFIRHAYPNEPAELKVKRELTALGLHYFHKKDYAGAAKLLRASAQFCNDTQAQYYMGVLYNAGAGVARNDLAALYWFDRAADNDYEPAKIDKAHILEAYGNQLSAAEFQRHFEILAYWCETGTDDIAALPERAEYWKRIAMTEREKLRVDFYIDKKNHILEFEKKVLIAKALGSKTPLEEVRYTVGSKQYKGSEPVKGTTEEELTDDNRYYVSIKENQFGDKIIYEYVSVPTFDSGDRLWDSYRKYVLIYDGKDIDIIAFRGGVKLAKIEVYNKLTFADAFFKPYFEKLNYPQEALNDIKWV